MTNWGAHEFDVCRWVLNAVGPQLVCGFGGRYAVQDGGETPDVQDVLYQFDRCVVNWSVRETNAARTPNLEVHGTDAPHRPERLRAYAGGDWREHARLSPTRSPWASPANQFTALGVLMFYSRYDPWYDPGQSNEDRFLFIGTAAYFDARGPPVTTQ